MAAPQIGENLRIFVTDARNTRSRKLDVEDKLRVYINPGIVYFSKQASIIYEGCGSVLNGQLFGPVKRPKSIKIQAYDTDGKKFELYCDGILSRVIQHEYDHMNGIEYLEKVTDYKKMMVAEHYIKRIKTSKAQVSASKITFAKARYL